MTDSFQWSFLGSSCKFVKHLFQDDLLGKSRYICFFVLSLLTSQNTFAPSQKV
jgi:hypothetical protein